MSIAFSLGSLVAWAAAGAVAFEVARRRRAALAVASLPTLIALGIVAAAAVAGRSSFGAGSLAGILSALVLSSIAYSGGRLWERRIRRHDALQ